MRSDTKRCLGKQSDAVSMNDLIDVEQVRAASGAERYVVVLSGSVDSSEWLFLCEERKP